MKLNLAITGAILACVATFNVPAQGQEALSRWYLKADAGGNWTDDVDLKEFIGPVQPGSTLSLKPGMRLGVAGGYQLTDWFAPEAEFGMQHNQIDAVTGAWSGDGRLSTFPLLLNAKFQYHNSTPFTPYAGAGVGFSTAVLSLDNLGIGNTSIDGTEADMVFAWQAFAGLRYTLNERISLGLEYRFVASEGPTFEADLGWANSSDKIKLGDIQTHSVSFTFNYQF